MVHYKAEAVRARHQAAGDMETDRHDAAPPRTGAASPAGLLPEVEAYAHLLVVLFLVDHKHYGQVRAGKPGCTWALMQPACNALTW